MQIKTLLQLRWGKLAKPPRKIILAMRMTSMLVLFFCLQVAAKSNGQVVNLHLENVKITSFLKEIKTQTGYNVVSDQSLLNNAGKISIHVKSMPLEQALTTALKGTGIEFVINGKTIVLKKESISETKKTQAITEQKHTEIPWAVYTGKITDVEGAPLAKVSVLNLNNNRGTSTKEDGTFSIEANVGDRLSISYVGYKSIVHIVSNEKYIKIELQPRDESMEEFVATGYQNIRKTRMTGAVSSVKAEDLLINGNNTVEQMLQGKIPGMQVVSNSGMVGTRQTVRVRGTSTLLGNQEPVWVVDGIIQEDPLPFQAKELNRFNQEPSNSQLLKDFIGSTISWLNPYDIEEVTVLKDAASTAIYGVKAANGVILITTKRGKMGRPPSVTYNTSVSTQAMLTYDKMNLMNSKERVDVSREIWQNGLSSNRNLEPIGYSAILNQYLQKQITYEEFNAGVKELETVNTDWFDILFQRPINQSHSLNISGGGPNNSYYASFGANSQKGQAKGNGQTGYQGSINLTSNITSRLTATVKLAGSYSRTEGFMNEDPYTYARTTSRVISAYNKDGTLSYYPIQGNVYAYNFNILNELNESGNANDKTSLNSNINIRYRFDKGFSFESLFGVNYSNTSSEGYLSEKTREITDLRGYEYNTVGPQDALYSQSKLPHGGMLTSINQNNYNYTWRNGLNYGRTFKGVHAVTGLVGMELRSNIYKGASATVYGYMPDRGKIIIAPPAIISTTSGGTNGNYLYSSSYTSNVITDRKSNYVSYYGTGGYTYDNRYTATLSVRGDASNRFGQDTRSRFKPIWAAGARWNIANEKFFQKSEWLTDMALRASYGFQGNVAENYGPDLVLGIPNSVNSLTGEYLYTIANLPYADLRWEKTQSVNLGFDLNLFNGRVNTSVEYYNKRSTDLIILAQIPFENGTSSMPVNSGTLYNRGIDITLNFTPIRTKDFTWSLGITPSKNFNKITSRLTKNPTWYNATSGSYFVEGYPVSSFWVFDFVGLDSATGAPKFNVPNTAQNPDAKFDATAFMKYGGKLNADFTSGFNTSLRYKGFMLSTSWYLSLGNQKILPSMYLDSWTYSSPSEYGNISKDLVNRWRSPNDNGITNIPALPSTDAGLLGNRVTLPYTNVHEYSYRMYNYSTERVVNASYARINNVMLNYNVPTHFIKHIFAKSATIGYSVNNLYTFVSKDYKGVDPEVASGSQPLPRIHSFNLAITF